MHKRSEEQEKADRREAYWMLARLIALAVVAIGVMVVFDDRPEVDAGEAAEIDIAIVTREDQAAARAAAKTEQKGD